MRGAWGSILPQQNLTEFHSIHVPWKSNWSKASTWQHVTGEEYAPETAGVHVVLVTPVVFGTQVISAGLSAFFPTQLPLRCRDRHNFSPHKEHFHVCTISPTVRAKCLLEARANYSWRHTNKSWFSGKHANACWGSHEGVKAADHVLLLWTHL